MLHTLSYRARTDRNTARQTVDAAGQRSAPQTSKLWPCAAGAFLFEDVGVTAFHGAINSVTDKSNLALLASIAPIEAYHAAILRTLLFQKGLEVVTPYDIRVFDFVQVGG